jgi:hypothetical protein
MSDTSPWHVSNRHERSWRGRTSGRYRPLAPMRRFGHFAREAPFPGGYIRGGADASRSLPRLGALCGKATRLEAGRRRAREIGTRSAGKSATDQVLIADGRYLRWPGPDRFSRGRVSAVARFGGGNVGSCRA